MKRLSRPCRAYFLAVIVSGLLALALFPAAWVRSETPECVVGAEADAGSG
jgi:hypothetical protein